MMKTIKLIRNLFANKGYINKIAPMFRMFRANFSGKFKIKPKYLIISALIFIYIISPLDFIPGILIDDAGLFFLALSYLVKEIDRYSEWESVENLKFIEVETVE